MASLALHCMHGTNTLDNDAWDRQIGCLFFRYTLAVMKYQLNTGTDFIPTQSAPTMPLDERASLSSMQYIITPNTLRQYVCSLHRLWHSQKDLLAPTGALDTWRLGLSVFNTHVKHQSAFSHPAPDVFLRLQTMRYEKTSIKSNIAVLFISTWNTPKSRARYDWEDKEYNDDDKFRTRNAALHSLCGNTAIRDEKNGTQKLIAPEVIKMQVKDSCSHQSPSTFRFQNSIYYDKNIPLVDEFSINEFE